MTDASVMPLSAATRERLAKLLGMVGSSADGEVVNAARLADRLVRESGLTWHDIVDRALPPPDHEPAAGPLRGDWRAMAAACARFPHLIDKWEWQFLSGLQRFPRLSSKQRVILIRIVARLRAAGCPLSTTKTNRGGSDR